MPNYSNVLNPFNSVNLEKKMSIDNNHDSGNETIWPWTQSRRKEDRRLGHGEDHQSIIEVIGSRKMFYYFPSLTSETLAKKRKQEPRRELDDRDIIEI